MIKTEKTYLLHIIESINFTRRHQHKTLESFIADDIFYEACLRRLQTLAESTQRLSNETKSKYSWINWTEIKGFRNALVHDYLGDIIPEVIWEVLTIHLPKLEDMAHKELKLLEENK